jgi:hypothetical protein
VIDNLLPESEGVKLYVQQQSIFDSVMDFLRFTLFNLFQTSPAQRQALGNPDKAPVDIVHDSVRNLGHKVLLAALPDDDPFLKQLTAAREDAKTKRDAVDSAFVTGVITNTQLDVLCQAAIATAKDADVVAACTPPDLGKYVFRNEDKALKQHIAKIASSRLGLTFYVYGHTHLIDKRLNFGVSEARTLDVYNTGAFQRVTDLATLLEIAQREGLAADHALELSPDQLPACYTGVVIKYGADGKPAVDHFGWYMNESDARGEPVNVCDQRCGVKPVSVCSEEKKAGGTPVVSR